MNRHERRKQKVQVKRVRVEDIRPGPVQHPTLPPLLVLRIQNLHNVFGRYFKGDGIGEWIEGFQRDMHPEKEVAIWEGMARAYTTYTAGRDLTPEALTEVYTLLLANTMGDVKDHIAKLQHLSSGEVVEVLQAHLEAWKGVKEETGFDKGPWAYG